jgi:hypothetical protein
MNFDAKSYFFNPIILHRIFWGDGMKFGNKASAAGGEKEDGQMK